MSILYVIIDMQNDFVTGPLGTAEAKAVAPKIAAKIQDLKRSGASDYDILFTKDTHDEDYLFTQEGRKLPVPHCIRNTPGWNICRELLPYSLFATILQKPTFGCTDLVGEAAPYDKITVMGVCTDICVISNALLLKAFYPEKKISVDSSCCAGSSPEDHERALQSMAACHIDIV